MKLFLDSAKVDEIRHALDMWDIDGVTTNPRHVKESGKPFLKLIGEIAEMFAGTDKKASVEVNPNLTEWEPIVEQAVTLAAMSPNFVIKVGACEGGFRAIRELAQRGIHTNATLIFSTAQAWQAARAGATYISPFLGWREQFGDRGNELVSEIRKMLDNYDYESQIIAAALRNSRQIAEASIDGAHVVTAGFAVYMDSFENPYTTRGEGIFQGAWDATPQE